MRTELLLQLASLGYALQSWPLKLNDDDKTGFVAETWGSQQVLPDRSSKKLRVTGNNRLYLVRDWAWANRWRDAEYKSLKLIDQRIEFTVRPGSLARRLRRPRS